MAWVATATIGGAIIGGLITANGSQNAAQTQANASTQNEGNVLAAGRQASQMDLGAINSANAPLQQYVNLGNNATGTLNNMLNGQNNGQMLQAMQNMPGYQFQLQQGLEATQNGFAAQGLGSSGAAMKGAGQYANGLAASNYNSFFNNALSAANLGAGAATTQSQNTGNLTTAASNALVGGTTNAASLGLAGAAAQASGQIGAANAIGGGIANAGNNYAQYNLMRNALATPAGGYNTAGTAFNNNPMLTSSSVYDPNAAPWLMGTN